MVRCGKNKNELLVLTGAVYSFVAYLTAFTLEVLFIIDLAKRSGSLVAIATTTTTTSAAPYGQQQAEFGPQQQAPSAFEQARLAFESMQAHVTISCLAISILYFVLFVASLILIVALILRSTFFILIWMCIMTTMYLPEFGLITYVTVYGWGLGTRNGQTELIFYLFRAALNVIFVFRAHRLFKDWSYEKNFFMLKSGSRGSRAGGAGSAGFAGYDSPYFIGDSLTTTINPVFSTSTLNLDRYDQVRDVDRSPATNNISSSSNHNNNNSSNYEHYRPGQRSSLYLNSDFADGSGRKYRNSNFNIIDSVTGRKSGFYLPNSSKFHQQPTSTTPARGGKQLQQSRQDSVLSIDDTDDYADFEMDLDYRTLTTQRHYNQQQQPTIETASHQQRKSRPPQMGRVAAMLDSSDNFSPTTTTRSPGGLSYSTQSLDRRHLRDMDFSIPEHVILRPLGHQPFDYLQRPGSTSNLNSSANLNTQPSSYSSNTKLAKTTGFNMNHNSNNDDHNHRHHHRHSRFI